MHTWLCKRSRKVGARWRAQQSGSLRFDARPIRDFMNYYCQQREAYEYFAENIIVGVIKDKYFESETVTMGILCRDAFIVLLSVDWD